MAVFEYGTDNEEIGELAPGAIEDITSEITPIDEDVEVVSVVDQGTGEYSYLRQGIPTRFADEMDISAGDDVLVKRFGDALVVVKP